MNSSDLLRAGMAGLLAHKFRSALTLLGVILGALLLFCSLSGGMGVTKAIDTKLAVGDRLREILVHSGVKTDEVTLQRAKDAGFTEAMSDERRIRLATASGVGGMLPVPMNLAASEEFAKIPNVTASWSRLSWRCSLHFESTNRWALAEVRALPPKSVDHSVLRIAGAGEGPSTSKSDETSVWISELFLYQNGIRTEQELEQLLGTSIELTSKAPKIKQSDSASDLEAALAQLSFRSPRYTISGVFRYPDREELRSNPDLRTAIQAAVLLPYDEAKACYRGLGLSQNNTSGVVLVNSAEDVLKVESQIGEQGFATKSLVEIATQIQTAVLLITLIITSIATGALLISAIGITNTMVMNVLERRKDIAVMKAIGARDRDLKRMFLIEGFLMGLVGGTIGLVLGLLFAELCGHWIRQQLEKQLNEPMDESVFAFPWWLIVGTPLLASIVTMLASYLPARRAAKIDPAQILRGL